MVDRLKNVNIVLLEFNFIWLCFGKRVKKELRKRLRTFEIVSNQSINIIGFEELFKNNF
jgi:hypothetical protein